jgi:hypothetical protein
MKRFHLSLLFCTILVLIDPISTLNAAEREPAKRAFSLVIRGGAGSFNVGDLNTTLSSIDTVFDAGRQAYPDYITGRFPEASGRFKDWEVEIQWTAWKGLSVGVALSGPVHLNSKGFISYLYTWTQAYSVESEVRMAAPIKFNLYYSFPFGSKFHLILNGGVGLYHGRMAQTYNSQRRYLDTSGYGADTDVIGNYHFDVSGHAAGFHCGVALEYEFNDRFSITAEGQWRFAKIKSLKGSSEYATRTSNVYGGDITSSDSDSQHGYLYHYIVDLYGWEELAVYSDPSIAGDGVSGLRKAFLDLSGFTFRIGLRIGLF